MGPAWRRQRIWLSSSSLPILIGLRWIRFPPRPLSRGERGDNAAAEAHQHEAFVNVPQLDRSHLMAFSGLASGTGKVPTQTPAHPPCDAFLGHQLPNQDLMYDWFVLMAPFVCSNFCARVFFCRQCQTLPEGFLLDNIVATISPAIVGRWHQGSRRDDRCWYSQAFCMDFTSSALFVLLSFSLVSFVGSTRLYN